MNCDEAFEYLTDPVLSSSEQLEWHLSQCPRCRQMQETLAPALMLFESSAAPADTQQARRADEGAPSRPVSSRPAPSRGRRLKAAGTTTRTSNLSGGLRYLMAACVGGLIAWNVSGLFGMNSEALPSVTPDSSQCLWKSPEKAGDLDQQAIVVSCVSCHLQHGVQTTQ